MESRNKVIQEKAMKWFVADALELSLGVAFGRKYRETINWKFYTALWKIAAELYFSNVMYKV